MLLLLRSCDGEGREVGGLAPDPLAWLLVERGALTEPELVVDDEGTAELAVGRDVSDNDGTSDGADDPFAWILEDSVAALNK